MSYYQINTPLTLSGDPVDPLQAVTKQYIDAKNGAVDGVRFQTGVLAVEKLPALVGEVSSNAGTNALSLVDSGVSPGIKFRVDVDSKGRVVGGDLTHVTDGRAVSWSYVTGKPTTLGGYGITDVVGMGGGMVSGTLASGVAASSSLHAVNKTTVDTTVGGMSMSAVVVGDIARSPVAGTPTGFLRVNGGILSKTTYAALYAIIGDSYLNSAVGCMGQPWRQQSVFNTTQSTDITGWTIGVPLPTPGSQHQAIVTKNRVYLLGGVVNGAYSSTVYTAPINADGTLGTWTTGTALPTPVAYSQAIVTKNRVYLLGGFDGNASSSTVYTAPINVDGTLGPWTTGTALPGTIVYTQAIVTNSRVYLLGGLINSAHSSTVYTAPINSDGTLGTWTTGTALPGAVGDYQAIVTKNRVYLLGGISSGTPSATVYTAPINVDGTLGTWTTGTALPATVAYSQAIVTKNRVYLLGGYINSAYSSTVYTAPINEDGTLGTWTTGTALLATVYYSQAIVTKNRVYLLGGYINGSYSSTVYTAPFSGGVNDYLALIAANTVDSATQFKLPDLSALETDGFYYYIKY